MEYVKALNTVPRTWLAIISDRYYLSLVLLKELLAKLKKRERIYFQNVKIIVIFKLLIT